MASYINQFISSDVPMSWIALLAKFGRTVEYWPGGDEGQALPLDLIWLEGMEDEESSPGRYSHAKLQNAALPQAPALGDALEVDGAIFDVVRVNAHAIRFSTIILQERD